VHLLREPSWTCCVLVTLVWSRQSLHLSDLLNAVQHRAGEDEWWQLVGRYLGGAWCVPESSRTSGLSAGSGDLRDRRSTADTRLVVLSGVGSPGARVSSGDLRRIVGWR